MSGNFTISAYIGYGCDNKGCDDHHDLDDNRDDDDDDDDDDVMMIVDNYNVNIYTSHPLSNY